MVSGVFSGGTEAVRNSPTPPSFRKEGVWGNPPATGRLLARLDDWSLFDRMVGGPEWRNLKLVRSPAGAKGNWWLAHNGVRFAENRDHGFLATHYPEVLGWVADVLAGRHD